MYNVVVISVDELWLKGKNRPVYFKTIRRHIYELIKAYHNAPFTCTSEEQRIVAKSDTFFSESCIQALVKVPGIHSVAPARRIPVAYELIMPAITQELLALAPLPRTFKVHTKRSYKGFPNTSMEISAKLGGEVLTAFPQLKVDVNTPEMIIEIRIMENNIYVSTRQLKGIGGLPVGTSGHVLSLLSGGFDSPVASYLMAKRGCRLTFAFFYAYPFVGDEVKDKIIKLTEVLGRFQRFSRLFIIPFGEVQNAIAKECKNDYRTVLFRKAMLECANLLARKIHADALVTGDSLGQVSSQTIGNISALDDYSTKPIFRPLIGFNKIEIIDLAKKIGTHDISVIPHDDACSLFAPKHPIIKPDTDYLKEFAQQFPLENELKEAIEKAWVYEISLSGSVTPLQHP